MTGQGCRLAAAKIFTEVAEVEFVVRKGVKTGLVILKYKLAYHVM